jgi:hypothetical protein
VAEFVDGWKSFGLPAVDVGVALQRLASVWLRLPTLLLRRAAGYCAKHAALAAEGRPKVEALSPTRQLGGIAITAELLQVQRAARPLRDR